MSTKSKPTHRYTLLVEWSEEDGCYIGRCPELMLGGVHGNDRAKVFAELEEVVEEWIADAEKHGEELPDPLAGKELFGKFVLGVGKDLQKAIAIAAQRSSLSLNNYAVQVLARGIDPTARKMISWVPSGENAVPYRGSPSPWTPEKKSINDSDNPRRVDSAG